MLPTAPEREAILTLAANATKPGGFCLVADEPKHIPSIVSFFEAQAWTLQKKTRNRVFARR